MCFNAGAKNEDTVFLFTDTQIVKEDFLEDINNMLNSGIIIVCFEVFIYIHRLRICLGEVPNLFESDEYEKVIIAVREAAKTAGVDTNNRDGIFDFFINRVRSTLHLVICMSPVGDAFR